MPFTTLAFIGFFAALFFAYYAVPKRCQWWLLLVGSMFFYGYASPLYLLLLWATILVTYLGTFAVANVYARRDEFLDRNRQTLSREEKRRCKAGADRAARVWLAAVIVILLLTLGVFKYAQFAIDNFLSLLGLVGVAVKSDVTVNVILPVGLSFYLFQSIGYCIDVYREEVPAERNLLKHALFVSFFPQLLQGPIGNYGRLAPQLMSGHAFSYEQAKFGLQRVVWGFFKKLMIANVIADRINPCWNAIGDYPGAFCWLAILFLYAIQLYADFSGYMDIACGCSQMLGIKLDENFETPYFAKGIAEFWRRWHITLGVWFKEYVFYPILRSDWNGRLRKRFVESKYLANTVPTLAALLIVWSLIGLWHGADWSYLVYGLYHGGFIMASMSLAPVYERIHALSPRFFSSKAYALFQMARTFLIVVIGYALFKPADLGKTGCIVKACCVGDFRESIVAVMHIFGRKSTAMIAAVIVLVVIDWLHFFVSGASLRERIGRLPGVVRWGIYLAGVLFVLFYGKYGAQYDQFEYFKF